MNRLEAEQHDEGRVLINPAYRDVLAANDLITFDAVMAYRGGEVMRTLAWRDNVRIELADEDDRRVVLYAKRHRAPSRREQVWRRLTGRPASSFGRREWDAVAALTAADIPTLERVAVGEQRGRLLPGESFFIAAALEDYRPADDLLREMNPDERAPLLQQIAALARRFHDAGLNHRDLYLCHFFVRPQESGGYDVTLIDLQRVERLPFRGRWLVKDIAQVAYSARGILDGPEWERWLCDYFGTDALSRSQHRFADAVRRKADRIARHDRRLQARRRRG